MIGVIFMVPNFRRLLLLSAVLAAPVSAQSSQRVAGFENLEMLDSRISAALGAGIGEPGGAVTPLDRRLHLAACPQPVEIAEPAMGAVTVRCTSLGWRIRVPLVGNGQASASTTAAAAVRAQPTIRRGDQIQLVAISAGFTVSTLAVADQDGGPGDRIRVRTEHRSAPVIGQILEDGRVALPGFN
jgi:flagella basal body P-ring formation protein FlgA